MCEGRVNEKGKVTSAAEDWTGVSFITRKAPNSVGKPHGYLYPL